ncbi:MAG: ATP-binding protein [Candidatus Dormibacteria bacterium]
MTAAPWCWPPTGASPTGAQVFADQVVAGAIVDRRLHDATLLNIRSHSYRTRAHQEPTMRKGGTAVVR